MHPDTPLYSSQSQLLQQTEPRRWPRTQRVDYKALASGKFTRFVSSVRRKPVSEAMAPTKSSMGPSNATEAGTNSAESRANAHSARAALREQKLRSHPHADVRGPELVVCRLCKQQIKLSTKSAYDAFHWNKHIERCSRRAPAAREQRVMRATERKNRIKPSRNAEEPVEKRTGLTIRLRAKGANIEPPSMVEIVPVPDYVKDETSDGATEPPSPSSPRSRSSPLLATPSPPPPPALPLRPEPDMMMEDYYRRSRRRGTRELSPFTLEAAAAWTWSQVKEPVWVIRSYPSSDSQESEMSSNLEKNPGLSGGALRTSDGNEAWTGGSLATRNRLDEPATR